ncbi:dioxygenase [Rhodoblastus sphagnicola]|uniref:Dioxygenase n=1 Tax=Rhodoblastus sphagnicola TaxID=333368 RepID=A0A2S6N999_9HYPH|nr:class III extradiol ring-cleavage dioxygenase [Rhodoblastus sphagnicola]MBB4196523.1 aromatic ring-opening dioxygenase catalytic subunit (LigB family) [Rhodoblastus sphagnicola]PPQ31192.1 dioxygenase [Rhodoblastus sphagnicola]
MTFPTYYIPHGGGPCFFMNDSRGVWTGMADFLRGLPSALPARPKAIVMVSGHWETDGFTFSGADRPELIYDYSGFPAHTYQLRYDVPGAPGLAARAAEFLRADGLAAGVDPGRGLDHGVFIPLKVAFPEADVPVVEMSLDRALDPALHLRAGRALSRLRDEGVLILGSGMSFHNMRAYGDPRATAPSRDFDLWLTETAALDGEARAQKLERWSEAPSGRFAHPREEHLLPLMVAAGASENPGARVYAEEVLATALSAYRFT